MSFVLYVPLDFSKARTSFVHLVSTFLSGAETVIWSTTSIASHLLTEHHCLALSIGMQTVLSQRFPEVENCFVESISCRKNVKFVKSIWKIELLKGHHVGLVWKGKCWAFFCLFEPLLCPHFNAFSKQKWTKRIGILSQDPFDFDFLACQNKTP